MKKILTSLLAILTLLVTVLAPLTSVVAQTPPDTTNIHITKVVWDTDAAPVGYPKEHDGGQLTIDDFGTGATFLAGAIFDYWKITAEEYDELMEENTGMQYLAEPDGPVTGSVTTGTDGKTPPLALREGYYWFKERTVPGVTEYIATSFGVVLPFAIVEDNVVTGYLNDLYVYPKNLSTVTLEKTVEDLVLDNATYDIGEVITYYVEAKIPAGNITAFTLTDTLSTGLEFVENSGKLYFSTTKVTDTATLTGGADIGGATPIFDVLATNATALNAHKGDYVYIAYQAKITSDAVVGTDIENEVTLNISRDGQETVRTDTADVHTGGKKFIKRNRSNAAVLAGAEFVVKNEAGKFYHYDSATDTVSWMSDLSDATKLVSSDTGKFEIKGLAYGLVGEDAATARATTYYLYEVKAPTGFVIPQSLAITGDGTGFQISANSYAEGETELTVETPTGTIVNNAPAPSIPNTGGIGAIVFILGGLAVIAVALVGIRKRLSSK